MDTKTAIQQMFLKLYAQKPINRITVKELCAKTPVARTTFYFYYRNIDELLAAIEDKLLGDLLQAEDEITHGDFVHMDFGAFIRVTYQYVHDHWKAFKVLLVTQPDLRFEEKMKRTMKLHLTWRYPAKQQMPNYGLMLEMLSSALIGGYRYWLQNAENVSETEFERMLTESFDRFMNS